jgi:MYXO-CTERM domain-containing protein
MDDPWRQLPRAAAIVYVGVLAAGSSRVARAEQEPEATPSNADAQGERTIPIAPTCGPACHSTSNNPMFPLEPEPDDGDVESVEPPPIQESKKGCAVESTEADEPGAALLGLGLLAGVAARRRRRGDESR